MRRLFPEIPFLSDGRITLQKITLQDTAGMSELVHSDHVYRYLPTFLYEKQCGDITWIIRQLYDGGAPDSMFLGVFEGTDFCGIAEFYTNFHSIY